MQSKPTLRVVKSNESEPSTRRVLPHNIEMEQSVLGAILIDPDAIRKVIPIIKSSDFYLEKHAWIYEAAGSLYAKSDPIDFMTMLAELERNGKLNDVGGASYITQLLNVTPSALSVTTYANEVFRIATQRRIILAGFEIAEIGYSDELEPDAMKTEAQEKLNAVQLGGRVQFESANDVGMAMEKEIVSYFENPGQIRGLATGYKQLDKILRGLRKGDNIVIAGRPGMGKTAFATGIAVNAALEDKRVAYFSMEMSKQQMMMRAACYMGGFDAVEVESGYKRVTDHKGEWTGKWRRWTDDEQSAFWNTWVRLEALPINWNDAGGITTTEAHAATAELVGTQGVDLVLFDHLGLAGDEGKDTYQQISRVSNRLKNMYMRLDIPGITLSQLNRDCEKRADKRPQLSDLRDSGNVEQDADVVVMLYRPKAYWDTESKWLEAFPRQQYPGDKSELIVCKNRRGGVGNVDMMWKAEHTRFYDIDAAA